MLAETSDQLLRIDARELPAWASAAALGRPAVVRFFRWPARASRPARRTPAAAARTPNTDDTAITVEVTYMGRVDFPRVAGQVQLESPWLDLPLKDARWELFVPPDFAYRDFAGTMSYESADLMTVNQDFTFAFGAPACSRLGLTGNHVLSELTAHPRGRTDRSWHSAAQSRQDADAPGLDRSESA